MRILVTAGGTREPIDGVRYIGNFSSGATGATIANASRAANNEVTYLHGIGAVLPKATGENIEFSSYGDLKEKMKLLLETRQYDSVVHLAAVSDYSVDFISADGRVLQTDTGKKLSSDTDTLTLNLKRNPKLLSSLKDWALNKQVLTIGFKLTNGSSDIERMAAVQKVFDGGGVDWIVHNDLTEISENEHVSTLYGPMGPMKRTNSKEKLAIEVLEICGSNSIGGQL